MSSLNLVPNPAIMGIEAGIFLANLVAVKKLFLEPYLDLHSARVKLTKGSQDVAATLDVENSLVIESIQSRIQGAVDESRTLRDSVLGTAKSKRDQLVTAASGEAQAIVATINKELASEIELHKKRLPELARDLTRQLLEKLVPA